MAPSSGHLLVPKVMKVFKYAVNKTADAVRARLAQVQQGAATVGKQPIAIPIRSAPHHPVHPLAALKQFRASALQTRTFTSSVRRAFVETYPSLRSSAPRTRASFPVSRTSALLSKTPSAPTFASTLRPNLTGGALGRTAGGYTAGSIAGRRLFSHVPSAQTQVVQNVSAAVRAFWVGGQRGQFDGVDSHTGEKRFVAVGVRQEDASKKMMRAKFQGEARGTSLEFCIVPELKNSLGGRKKEKRGLNAAVRPLATDFARSLGQLAAVHRDLKRLSALGDLPVSEPRPGWIAVRFPGCDGKAVESLCVELGVSRGIVREDEAWAEERAQDVKMALLFPTAPSDHAEDDAEEFFYEPMTISPRRDLSVDEKSYTADETPSPLDSERSQHSYDHVSSPRSILSWQPNPWDEEVVSEAEQAPGSLHSHQESARSGGEMESIYRFLAECDGRIR